MDTIKPAMADAERTAGSLHRDGSVSVSQLKPIIEESEKWAKEYIKREARYRARGAHREAAHFEDLISAHQNFAGSLRQLVWAAEKRQPTAGKRTLRSHQQVVCLRCDGEGDVFETKVQTFEQLFKGETIAVTGETQTCKKCGWFTLTLDQLNTIYQQTKRKYAKRKPANEKGQRPA